MLIFTMPSNIARYLNISIRALSIALISALVVACSSSGNVPINDRSSGRSTSNQAKSTTKVAPIATGNASVKSDPVKEAKNSPAKSDPKSEPKQANKSEPKQTESKQAEPKQESKVEAKPEAKPETKVDSSVPDADFSVARPATGQTVGPYNGGTNKGIDIAGKMGDPIFAGADGKVIFADSFKGYGNTLIVKHNNRFVTVYSHNKTLLVKEGQQIKRGQKIAEMGDSEAERVKLHFEVRRDGKPVDPAGYLQ